MNIVFNFRLWCMCCVARAEINVRETFTRRHPFCAAGRGKWRCVGAPPTTHTTLQPPHNPREYYPPPPSLTHNVDPINTTATKFPLSCVNNLIPFLLAFRLQKVIFQLCRFLSQTRHLPFYDSLSSAAASNQWCWYMLAPEVHDGTKLSSMMSLSPMLIEWLYWKRT